MSTFNQVAKTCRPKRTKKTKYFLFQNRPQKKVRCLNVLEMAPRKPNSAKRNIADVFWFQKPKFKLKHQVVYVKVLVPGQAKQVYRDKNKPPKRLKGGKKEKRLCWDKFNMLPKKKGARFLIQGATVKDLPRVKYKIIRKHDGQGTLEGLHYRRKSRSKYGANLYGGHKTHGARASEIDERVEMDRRKYENLKALRRTRRIFKYRNFTYR